MLLMAEWRTVHRVGQRVLSDGDKSDAPSVKVIYRSLRSRGEERTNAFLCLIHHCVLRGSVSSIAQLLPLVQYKMAAGDTQWTVQGMNGLLLAICKTNHCGTFSNFRHQSSTTDWLLYWASCGNHTFIV